MHDPLPNVPQLLGILAVVLAAARLLGAAIAKIGQPAVLGELIAGVLLGSSVFGIVDPLDGVLHTFAELGVVILLFEIGLETDLTQLLRAGIDSIAVAIAGVVLPFAAGYFVCRFMGLSNTVAIFSGAALTATSVGITARVLNDLGRLKELESQIIIGAAVIDDILGLVILTIVGGMAKGDAITAWRVVSVTALAFGFLIGTILIGSLVVPWLMRLVSRVRVPGFVPTLGLLLAFGLAWGADAAGSAAIIGAFAAGLLLRPTPYVDEIEKGIAPLGHFFIPIFFVVVGASVDLHVFAPRPENFATLRLGGLLVVVAVLGKFLAGYAPFWFRGRKAIIGVGMIPRGEVGLIFAQMGLAAHVFDKAEFSAMTLMVMVTTFIAPPLLRLLFPPKETDGEEPDRNQSEIEI